MTTASGASFSINREQFQISEEFLAKYNRPGPRYTSYPTAPVWNDNFGHADAEQIFQEADLQARPLSLYTHLPFCESLCLFCACNVVIQKNKAVAPPYLETLRREIGAIARFVSRNRPVVQFHWGGGTPTYLSPAQMEELFVFTQEHFSFAADGEVGIEVDPRVTTRAHLESARKLGFNRISMGIQDFNPEVQRAVHRIQPYEITRDTIAAARDLGFVSVNVDLIYGLPYQTAESFAITVDQILTLRPDRVAMFSYAHVPWLKKQQGSFQKHLPEGMEKFRIFVAGLQRFLDAGYLYIGMDHFALPGDELGIAQKNRTLHRNFQGYTTKAGADLYGFGVSAISGVGNAYTQNYRDLHAYQDAIARGGLATMRGYRKTHDDEIRGAVISRLLCHAVVDMAQVGRDFALDFRSYFAGELERLEEHRADNLIAYDGDDLWVTPLGRIFIRNVAMVFDPYLERQPADKPLFSKTL
jgi:oxygen-independent coproporphyrinogen-3 oxidase